MHEENVRLQLSAMRMFTRIIVVVLTLQAHASYAAESENYDWAHYGNDLGHSKYAPLDQINQSNVHELEVRWNWASIDNQSVIERPQFIPSGFKATPITLCKHTAGTYCCDRCPHRRGKMDIQH